MNKYSSKFEYNLEMNSKKQAFTIAEVLIAMMIMVFAMMVLSPVVTKRNAKAPLPHGSWECYLQYAEDGTPVHYSKLTKDDGSSVETREGANCIFRPQPSAEEYLVTVVGGGGGGAAGTSASFDAASYGETVGFKVERTGEYDIVLVGGGGSGSARPSVVAGYTSNTLGAISGSAGEIKYVEQKQLTPGVYILKAGRGGTAGGLEKSDAESEEDNDAEETEHVPAVCALQNSYSSYPEVCDGEDGGKSYVLDVKGKELASARGGYGGGRDLSIKAKDSDGLPNVDSSICSTRKGGNSAGYITGSCKAMNELGYITDSCKAMNVLGLVSGQKTYLGGGGKGVAAEVAYPGYNGIAMISSGLFFSGGGGKAGNIAFTTVKNLDSDVVVTVGNGGLGGQNQTTNGYPGENSSFGYYITAKGGDGGEVKAKSGTTKNTKIEGEPGVESAFPGTTYGAGGNGGYAYSIKSTNLGGNSPWGQGSRGGSGYVRVEWN